MYNKDRLNEMPDAELKALAENLGLKKIDLSKKEDLVYRILDCQAENGAASRVAKQAQADADKTPKKRGRKKKEDKVAETVAAAPAIESAETPQDGATPERKRRGRPKKVKADEPQPALADIVEDTAGQPALAVESAPAVPALPAPGRTRNRAACRKYRGPRVRIAARTGRRGRPWRRARRAAAFAFRTRQQLGPERVFPSFGGA